MSQATVEDFLRIGRKIRVLPIIHGSGDFAIRAREETLKEHWECLAVPLPPSFQDQVEDAIEQLPTLTAVVQRDETSETYSYVPIDPCQGVIAAIRCALGERIPRAFIDLETTRFEAQTGIFPDPYALKQVRPESFAAALLPAIPKPKPGQHEARILWMAKRLRELEKKHDSILFICSLLDWPWIRDAYQQHSAPHDAEQLDRDIDEPESVFAPIQTYRVDPETYLFFLSELPFVTSLYERGRIELTPDDNLSVDGIKELMLKTRERLSESQPRLAERVTPQLLSIYFRYVRNLALIENRLTPDFYDLVVAAQQVVGDNFALELTQVAREYSYAESVDLPDDILTLRMGIAEADLPDWGVGPMVNRLPGPDVTWRSLQLHPRPLKENQERWTQRWDPYSQCSWPPEDERIESFQQHVREQAKAILGADLARSEKFTTSVMDGIDMRETLRHWHTGDLYVKVIPPSRGSLEIVVFLFDVPADPREYVHRTTWFAEHNEESTLAFYSTDPMKNLVGPGIAQAEYGGAFFLFPPRPIYDIWEDPRFNFTDTLEERLLAAALFHSREKHVALVSPCPPLAAWRRLARRFGKKIIHLPLKRFSGQTLERLRQFHVLNGKHVRSYAAEFIRDV